MHSKPCWPSTLHCRRTWFCVHDEEGSCGFGALNVDLRSSQTRRRQQQHDVPSEKQSKVKANNTGGFPTSVTSVMRPLSCCPAVVCDLGALSLYRITWLLPHHSNPETVCDLGALSLYRTTWLLPHRPEPHPKHCDSHQGEFVPPYAQLCTVQGGVCVDNNAAAYAAVCLDVNVEEQ